MSRRASVTVSSLVRAPRLLRLHLKSQRELPSLIKDDMRTRAVIHVKVKTFNKQPGRELGRDKDEKQSAVGIPSPKVCVFNK